MTRLFSHADHADNRLLDCVVADGRNYVLRLQKVPQRFDRYQRRLIDGTRAGDRG
jgi:hypothetical protein